MDACARVHRQFSTSGIYEAWRYAVMLKGILKRTKRPLVEALFQFGYKPVFLY